MNDRQRTRAVLHYQAYDRLPLCAFGYWKETAVKWAEQCRIRMDWDQDYAVHGDNGPGDRAIMDALGFDFNWGASLGINSYLFPGFQEELLEERAAEQPEQTPAVPEESTLDVDDPWKALDQEVKDITADPEQDGETKQ